MAFELLARLSDKQLSNEYSVKFKDGGSRHTAAAVLCSGWPTAVADDGGRWWTAAGHGGGQRWPVAGSTGGQRQPRAMALADSGGRPATAAMAVDGGQTKVYALRNEPHTEEEIRNLPLSSRLDSRRTLNQSSISNIHPPTVEPTVAFDRRPASYHKPRRLLYTPRRTCALDSLQSSYRRPAPAPAVELDG
ncbi:hypothetical protein IEQ34_002564 [Dendrobium chrysotoxum]|uniref:Uncharacterized protein n=1 Tax=Dendrobium chrysotoxum TaxID=161865 RepID=A0AAV7HEX4_DENCH|nr:hypothetical protein IEQ34_002564 [Dendrobium chrysotoxum]